MKENKTKLISEMQVAKDQEEKRGGLLIARITSKASPFENKFPQLENAAN
jgi:hypothetical protein